ncbi:Dihydrofolate reductase [Propionibacterium cyclohexanicum]|uniref:Dihydrofolate reductase n=1 Tax=Propionibacterium cyclohexanicum TaxID=64702 RepID=A0A1H9Q0F0_9ACTN|nr:dihydrofolate reductase family protein [Propionibacterium cyclohexanicum]SER53353.1 Dihydrofolate reductase [Propionibacterium cyclohexanicum]
MSRVIYSMGISLDGYIVGPDGRFDWTVPSEELFGISVDEIKQTGTYLLGRRLYETMLYWEDVDQSPSLDFSTLEWARLWRALPKVVFSTTLHQVEGNARLATEGLAGELHRLRAESVQGEIAIGGAGLAAQAAALDLIDEYRIRIHPVLLGGGTPFFAPLRARTDLELVENRTVCPGVVYLRYRVTRPADADARS